MKIRKVITIFGRKHRRVKLIPALGNAEVVCQSYSINKKGEQIIVPLRADVTKLQNGLRFLFSFTSSAKFLI